MRAERDQPFGVHACHDTAVVLHLYYPDMWDGVRAQLAHLIGGFDLLVTVPDEVLLADRAIEEAFPSAQIYRCENRGRDVAPFVRMLPGIVSADYKYVCKVHTKKSPHISNGQVWHDDMVGKLLGSAATIAAVKSAFDEHADWGLIAPRGHVLPLTHDSYYWGQNAGRVLELARAAGICAATVADFDFSFVGGSMFWFRPQALRFLAEPYIPTGAFEAESGQRDGTLAHAVERFIGLSAQRAGYEIAECDAGEVRVSAVPFHLRLLSQQTRVLQDSVEHLSKEVRAQRQRAETLESDSIRTLRGAHAGHTAWIIGKGPSLAMLSRDHLGEGPIIALNDAILPLEGFGLDNPLYSMQKDAPLYSPEAEVAAAQALGRDGAALGASGFIPIKTAILLVHQHESINRLVGYRPRYVFDNLTDFGLEWWEFSSLVAVAVARLFGCAKVVFVSHDACVFGDQRTCTPRPDGSFFIELEPPSSDNYLQHRQRIDHYLEQVSMSADWITPQLGGVRHDIVAEYITQLHDQTSALKADTDRRRTEVDRLSQMVDEYRRGTAELTAALQESNETIRAVAAQLAATSAETAVLTTSLTQRSQEVAANRRQVEALEVRAASALHEVKALRSSASWRWTAPLRAARKLLLGDKKTDS